MTNIDKLALTGLVAQLNSRGESIETLPTAIYARKSTSDESQVSISSQIDVCQRFIAEDSRMDFISVYSEEKASGYTITNRKAIQNMIRDVESGKIKVIVSYSLDRISRNVVDGAELDKRLENARSVTAICDSIV